MSNSIVKIALDAMSGDLGANSVVPAALTALDHFPHLHLVLVGLADELTLLVKDHTHFQSGRLSIHPCSQVVEMTDTPKSALKNKKDSSMRVSLNLVKSNEVSACVSAGNTGALMATARFVLGMLPGIDRPAICTALPTTTGHVHMLDLGANVDSSAEHLYQFALMGSILCQSVDDVALPKVGLLNIGEEEIKGNEQVKAAARLLQEAPLNYIGYIEGHDIFLKDLNVVVCDGFVGNVALKTIEGTSKLISHFLNQEFKRTIWTKIAALIAMPVLKSLKARVDPRKYNGASLLGLNGVVVKSHGNADEFAFFNAIVIAKRQVEQSILTTLRTQFAQPCTDEKTDTAL